MKKIVTLMVAAACALVACSLMLQAGMEKSKREVPVGWVEPPAGLMHPESLPAGKARDEMAARIAAYREERRASALARHRSKVEAEQAADPELAAYREALQAAAGPNGSVVHEKLPEWARKRHLQAIQNALDDDKRHGPGPVLIGIVGELPGDKLEAIYQTVCEAEPWLASGRATFESVARAMRARVKGVALTDEQIKALLAVKPIERLWQR